MTAESVVVGGLWGTDQEQDRSSVIRFFIREIHDRNFIAWFRDGRWKIIPQSHASQ
jgi:hypothetical protein